jgi:hypothetical protein|tara:strand:- start:63 stop:287 length:225 start_codon:yes stop_codon:yes gene_type:complete
MEQELYYLVLERLMQEFSGVGAIGGVATPLGTGPSGKVKYRSGKAKSNSAYKTKKRTKKSKSKNRSVQYYLKNN